jgi:tetratricopeptide (TPR) repeat protein
MSRSKKRYIGEQKETAQAPSVPPTTDRTLSSTFLEKIFLSAITFGVALAGYATTLARTVTLVDSGELITACARLGVAHPPGFPLYVMLGHLFTKLPVGSVAARVSFMSAFFAAAAAAILTLISAIIIEALDEYRPRSEGSKKKTAGKNTDKSNETESAGRYRLAGIFHRFLPVAVGLTFAFSLTLWFYASVAEVYTLNIALFAAVVYLMILWQRTGGKNGWLIPAAAGVYGLALGVHHVTILLALPAFAFLVLRTAGIRFFISREMALAFGAVLVGLSVYLYLPLAAGDAPLINWGNPATFERFYWHISGKQYQVNLFSADAQQVARQFSYFVALIFRQFTPLGLAVALAGLWALWRRSRPLFWLLALIVFFDVAYSVNYDIAEDKDAYYLTTQLALAIALAAGAKQIFEWSSAKGEKYAAVALILLVSLAPVTFATHHFEVNKSRYLIARDFVENLLSNIEPGGLLLTLDWQFYSPYFYLHHVENLRPDVTVVDINLLRRSWYIEGYLKRQYPEMMRACAAETEAFLEDLYLFEHDRPYDVTRINTRFITLINSFIKYKMQSGSAYTMLPMEDGVGKAYTWVPQGLAFKFYPDQVFHPDPIHPLQLRGLVDDSVFLDEVAKGKVRKTYALMMTNRGKYLSLGGRYDEAFDLLHLSLQLDPELDRAYEFMGNIYETQGKKNEAADAYRKALLLNPSNTGAQQRLQSLQK